MDAFASMNEGLSYNLCVELTVHEPNDSRRADIAFQWLTEGVSAADAEGLIPALPENPRLSEAGYKNVPASAVARRTGVFGFLEVSPADTFGVLYNPYATGALPWLRKQLDRFPESAGARIGTIDPGDGQETRRISLSVTFDEDLPEYVKLVYVVDEAELAAQETSAAAHARLLATIGWAAHRFDVVFGHASYEHAGGATEQEHYTRGPGRVPSINTPLWRSRVRGYSWLTIVSGDIALALGGRPALEATGAFQEIEHLPNGSLLLLATRRFQDYRGEAVAAVKRALRDVLIDAELRQPPPVPGPPTFMVVFE
ncbi:hypothetical protein J7E93_03295 [Streptomyces sp. ISL-36]|uniref:hypothetical protein n=1 Tax=Streptomyces sp. ISL-36 TaxID=2819182 RepID=UPI001BE5559C|nr:hypothetical protein [Streptomyces sp. ISL-36]MBT2439162.1 hypothetical protein [Streptomyces sp. ISL-36]